MSTYRLHKALLITAGTFICASLGGISLANYVQGDAFSFYKQRVPYEPKIWTSAAAPSDWAYPAQARSEPGAYAPQPEAKSLYLAEASQPEFDDRELYRSYGYQSISSESPPQAEPERVQEPVVRVVRGSWTEAPRLEVPSPPREAADDPQSGPVEAADEAPAPPAPAPRESAPQPQAEPPPS
jgi:hypothetical protein